MILGIEHTAITSPDPKTLAGWFIDTLGFRACYESPSTVMVRAQNGHVIEITASEGDRAAHGLKSPGLRHLAILVDEFDRRYPDLCARGVRMASEPMDVKGNKVVFFTDPQLPALAPEGKAARIAACGVSELDSRGPQR